MAWFKYLLLCLFSILLIHPLYKPYNQNKSNSYPNEAIQVQDLNIIGDTAKKFIESYNVQHSSHWHIGAIDIRILVPQCITPLKATWSPAENYYSEKEKQYLFVKVTCEKSVSPIDHHWDLFIDTNKPLAFSASMQDLAARIKLSKKDDHRVLLAGSEAAIDCPNCKFDEQFILKTSEGNILTNTPYTIIKDNGDYIRGVSDAEGKTARVKTPKRERLRISIGDLDALSQVNAANRCFLSGIPYFDEQFLLMTPTDKIGVNDIFTYTPYTIKMEDGHLIRGISDAEGKTAMIKTLDSKKLEVYLGYIDDSSDIYTQDSCLVSNAPYFDEQFLLKNNQGKILANTPYTMMIKQSKYNDKYIRGRTNAAGKTIKIKINKGQQFKIYIGHFYDI